MAACDIGIDLGTTNVRIYVNGKGLVIDEPSVIAVRKQTGELVAVGEKAYRMLGKNPPEIEVCYPLEEGVISDYELNERMIRELLQRASNSMLMKPRVCLCVHTLITDVERRAVVDAAVSAGARTVYLIEEPIAAAIGAGIPLSKPSGVMVVDMGGGTVDVAVLSLNGTVVSRSSKIGGQKLDQAIARKVFQDYKLFIGESTAEHIKKEIGSVKEIDEGICHRVRGRDLATGLPRAISFSQKEAYDAIAEFISQILQVIRDVLEVTPPELIGDVYTHGILLTGGGALLRGMPERITEETGVPCYLADDPCGCVALGTSMAFSMLDTFNTGFINAATYEH